MITTELIFRILCDSIPKKADAAYLFAQTADNQESVLSVGIDLIKTGSVNWLLIFKQAIAGYPGSQEWLPIIKKVSDIPVISMGADKINTLIESELIVRQAKKMEWQKLIVVAPPFHQIRVFITAVSVALREYSQLKIYSCIGKALPWLEEVYHSQGVLRTTRVGLIKTEYERIEKYRLKGDLVSDEEILDYLNKRGD